MVARRGRERERHANGGRVAFCAGGNAARVPAEHYMDMATAVSGSGPAFVFLFMEAMMDAAVHMGFARKDAEKLVTQTVSGAAAYLKESGEHPTVLRNQVTSPGGTTAEGSVSYGKERTAGSSDARRLGGVSAVAGARR